MWYKSRFTIPAIAALCFCSIGGTTPAYADLGDQLFKLVANDGVAGDQFGISVAISGATAIVGAWGHDDNGLSSGSAYLFDAATGRQLFKLLPTDGAAQDRFGFSVAISGATAIVGARDHDDNGPASGSAYLFDTITGQQIAKLLADDGAAADFFGYSVAIGGATAIVGAYFDDDNGDLSGSAYFFDTTTGRQLSKLVPSDGAATDAFGFSVAISGATAIVAAPGDDDNGVNSGSAYLFDISDPAKPTQIAKLLADDGAKEVLFGWSVAISGGIAIVGAPRDNENGTWSGSAYLFDTSTGARIAKLLADDGAASDRFGASVAISGTRAIVGAWADDDNGHTSGSAYFFDTTTGRQLLKLLPGDNATHDRFGRSVTISGPPGKEVAIVGAPRHDDNGGNSGSAYLFDAAGTPACPWDLDDSKHVGAFDLQSLLAQWGADPGGPPDFDGNGDVGVGDLLILLANWGPCP